MIRNNGRGCGAFLSLAGRAILYLPSNFSKLFPVFLMLPESPSTLRSDSHYTSFNPLLICSTKMTQAISSSESRALQLLGQGIGPEQVASAVGLSTSRISQLLSDPEFAAQVAELRFNNLQKHNERDNRYDELEDKLLEKMKNCIPLMYKPQEVLRAIQVINAAKRRGVSAPDHITQQTTVVSLQMPVQVINQYKLDSNKQVLEAGQQTLLTAQSSHLQEMLAKRKEAQNVLSSSALPAPVAS